jgi:2-polyprenylphenol 6-hydroxylase
VVVGGGVVGASLVRALPEVDVALVGRPPAPVHADGFDVRVYALSPANVDFLRRLGVWDALAPRAAPVHGMRIYGDDARSALRFDAYETGVGELAWIVEDDRLQHALWSGLSGVAKRCKRLELREREALVTFDDGESVSGRLVVGADGAHSFVRQAAGIDARERDYHQVARPGSRAAAAARGPGFDGVVAAGCRSRPHGNACAGGARR